MTRRIRQGTLDGADNSVDVFGRFGRGRQKTDIVRVDVRQRDEFRHMDAYERPIEKQIFERRRAVGGDHDGGGGQVGADVGDSVQDRRSRLHQRFNAYGPVDTTRIERTAIPRAVVQLDDQIYRQATQLPDK